MTKWRFARVIAAAALFSSTFCTPVWAESDDETLHVHNVDKDRILIVDTRVEEKPGSSGDSSGEQPVVPRMWDQTANSKETTDGRTVTNQVAKGKDWCEQLFIEVVSSHPCFRFKPVEEEPVEESPGVDPLRVLYTAVASARIDGAGLVVEPGRDWVWMGVPTLAHAQSDTVETSVQVFDLNVPVTFRATRFVFDFHDGNPPVISSVPGAPYPDMTIQGVYPAVSERMFVTLTTTWDATVTHPTTGQELTVPGALRTVEDSRVFEVVRPKQRLISDREFGKNH